MNAPPLISTWLRTLVICVFISLICGMIVRVLWMPPSDFVYASTFAIAVIGLFINPLLRELMGFPPRGTFEVFLRIIQQFLDSNRSKNESRPQVRGQAAPHSNKQRHPANKLNEPPLAPPLRNDLNYEPARDASLQPRVDETGAARPGNTEHILDAADLRLNAANDGKPYSNERVVEGSRP